MANEPCPGCGHHHDSPFSEEMRALAGRIEQSKNPEERHALMTEMADLYAESGDWTDINLPEELHGMLEDHMRAKAESFGASLRLSRLLVRMIASFERHVKGDATELKVVTRMSATKSDAGPN